MSNLKKNVEQIRKARGLSQEELSARIGMAPNALSEFLASPPARKETILKHLSRELVVPEILLFANHVPVRDTSIPDFRLASPTPSGYSRETLRWIDFAESIQNLSQGLSKPKRSNNLAVAVGSDLPIPRAARKLREVLEFTEEEQLSYANPRAMFAALRQKVETLNVFVLQLSFPENDGAGFCVSGQPYDVIVLNTRKQSPARRSFTLLHEVYHCALGRSGVSDPLIAKNHIEKRCNSFAAEFLAPPDLVKAVAKEVIFSPDFNISELACFADKLNISMYVSLLRLVELGIYRERAIAAWKQYLHRKGDPEAPTGGGGRRQEEWKYKLSKYGFKFATVFGEAKDNGVFDDLEFFQFSGIKPKYQSAYIAKGSRGRAQDADVDDSVDDD
jgi:Zn-dependent peptidase ImmA (M78 family)